ncbi:MAG: hypothetical protein IKS07_07775 [Lachnospiraceae bacterium]|nr:hypothetical protein [Lachnospiraceae bacterium]
MALVAQVQNGQIQETASQSSLKKKDETRGSGNGMDKDAFLQLLVAQMQYQDPLEPTSNTEYVAQYAQFSQVEAINAMSTSMDLSRASALVGQEVYIKTTDGSGETKYVQGRVDYVVYEGGKPYLSIDEALYSLEDLDTVVDPTYQAAYDKAQSLNKLINEFPLLTNMTLADGARIDEVAGIYSAMSDYEKGFVDEDAKSAIALYAARIAEMRRRAEEAAETAQETAAADTASGDTEDATEAAEAVPAQG